MRSAYPKLVAGVFLFTLLGLAGGAAIAMFLFLAAMPMVQLLPDPSAASQFVTVLAAFAGILTSAAVVVLGCASWKKRLETELYRAQVQNLYPAAARRLPPPGPRHPKPSRGSLTLKG